MRIILIALINYAFTAPIGINQQDELKTSRNLHEQHSLKDFSDDLDAIRHHQEKSKSLIGKTKNVADRFTSGISSGIDGLIKGMIFPIAHPKDFIHALTQVATNPIKAVTILANEAHNAIKKDPVHALGYVLFVM